MSTAAVTVTAFGDCRREVALQGGQATVEDILSRIGVQTTGRRVAVNGHPAEVGSTVQEGDELTVVPRVQGG